MRLKVRDESHVNQRLAQGKEELPSVMTIGIGFPKKPAGGTAGQDMALAKVESLNDSTENLAAVQAGERALLGNGGSFLTPLRHRHTRDGARREPGNPDAGCEIGYLRVGVSLLEHSG